MRLIDADALKELFSEVIGSIAKKPEMNGNLEHMIRASAMVIQMIDDAPTVQLGTNLAEVGTDLISRQQAIDALLGITAMRNTIPLDSAIFNIKKLPSAQPEQRWIPCSERLPNKFEDVWVTDNRGRVAVCRMGHTGWRDMESDEWMYCLDSIVAWMPYYVPEPYQEGGEQE